jgi:two-component system NtrC family sensor kinase
MPEGPSPKAPSEGRIRAWAGSLAARLFLWIFAVMVMVFAVFGYLSFKSTSEQWVGSIQQLAHGMSGLIKRAIHDGMLLNRKEDVHNTIRAMASSPGVAGIRIYDKTGTIIFSADDREIGRRVDRKAEACVICHQQDQPLTSVPQANRVRMFQDVDGQRVLGLINPIENTPECATAPCHAHPNQSILGVLDLKMSIAYFDDARRQAKSDTVVVVALMALAGGLAAALFIYRVVRVPVRRLTQGIRRTASGDLTTHLDIRTNDEIGELGKAFDRMTDNLADAQRKNQEWSDQLEEKVRDKTEELGLMERHIAQVEKMASLGKLAATVAHELNNPLGGILVYAKLVDRMLGASPLSENDLRDVHRHLKLVQQETARCGDIVRNLLVFARESQVRFGRYRLNDVVDRSVQLLQHKFELSRIQCRLGLLEGDDELECDADQLRQVLVALLVNAVEAMPDGGELGVHVGASAEQMTVAVSDTGTGIPPDVLPHIFEPFYSTKDATKGVGLGLAVVYGIMNRHGGRVDVESKQGKGSTFRLVLPRHPPPERVPEPVLGAERRNTPKGQPT